MGAGIQLSRHWPCPPIPTLHGNGGLQASRSGKGCFRVQFMHFFDTIEHLLYVGAIVDAEDLGEQNRQNPCLHAGR